MNNDKSKVLLSLLAGAAAGVVAGLLLAPDSGKKSRATLKTSASKWGTDLDRVFRDGISKLQDAAGKMNMGMMGGSGQGKTGADDMFDSFSAEADQDGGRSQTGRSAGGRSQGSRNGTAESGAMNSSGRNSGSMGGDSGSGSMGGGTSSGSMGSGAGTSSPS